MFFLNQIVNKMIRISMENSPLTFIIGINLIIHTNANFLYNNKILYHKYQNAQTISN